MDIEKRNVWQVGTGSHERSYGDIFLKYDVMAVGPGDRGLYNEKVYSHYGDIKNSIRRFYQNAKKGDLVVLRLGTGQVLALGEIADDGPVINEEFGDIDDYHLQHVRRVRWFPCTAKGFPVRTLGGQVRTFAGVNTSSVLRWIERVRVSPKALHRKLRHLPKPSVSLSSQELKRELIAAGLTVELTNKVVARLNSLRMIAQWYQDEEKRLGKRPSEHETIAYMVIPFLQSLGWARENAAIEWNGIDIALFDRLPSKDAFLRYIVEAKVFRSSVFKPFEQAADYARVKGREHCKRLIVTDGIRYTYFKKQSGGFSPQVRPQAYLNILHMRKHYPLYGCGGAVEAIIGMVK
ncbi:MAG: hypothetical protein PHC37_02090 [Candidatus Omnitrophica bacterium]|nr:hypothetical protein [Candidatus Omnitrophota bacterium]MDD5690477.1 hypothetical protein [Candidatus Omnitrophota bacterium]